MGVGTREFQQAVENGDPFLKTSFSRPSIAARLPSCNVARTHGAVLPPAPPPQDAQVFDLLADEYLLCVIENGKLSCKSRGLNLRPSDERVVCDIFRRTRLSGDKNRDGWSSLYSRTRTPSITNSNVSSPRGGLSSPSRGKRRRSLQQDGAAYGQSRTRAPRSRIIRDLDDESSDADEIMPIDCGPETKVYFRVYEAVEIMKYMREALKAMQQRNCKLICKTWIQAFEPSKQTKFPYNANKKNDENRLSCRPETPYWWPPNIPHTEPDHLRLSDRVPLLLHMIYCREKLRSRHEELVAREPEIKAMDPNNPQAQVLTEELERLTIVRNFRAKDFLKFARQAAHRFEPPEAFICVEEMFRLREYQERHEAGGVDGATSISARSTDYMKTMIKEANRSKKGVAQTGQTSPSVTTGPSGRHTRSISQSPGRSVLHDDTYEFPEVHSPKKLRSQSNHNTPPDFSPRLPSPTKSTAITAPDPNSNDNSTFWPRQSQPQPQLFKDNYSPYFRSNCSRPGLYGNTPHQISGIYPRPNYGFIQSHDSQFSTTQPEDSPSPKWSAGIYMPPNHPYHGLPAPSNTPPMTMPSMYLQEQMTELDGSASTSFASGYDSEPPFRTGSLCHPNPRTGNDLNYVF